MLDLGALGRSKDVLPFQVIQALKKRLAGMYPISEKHNPTTMGQDCINRVEQFTRVICPGGIGSVNGEAERQTHAIGGEPNLHDAIIGVMAGFVHGQVEHLVGELGDETLQERTEHLFERDAYITNDPSNRCDIARVGARKGSALGDGFLQQRALFNDSSDELDKATNDGFVQGW